MATLGLELLWSSIKEELTCKNDAAVAVIHWILLKNSLKCVSKTEKDEKNKHGSEFLPEEWNKNKEVYSLHYTDGKDDYIIKIVNANDLLLVNVLNHTTDVISSVTVNVTNVNDDYKNYSSDLFKSLDELIKDVETEIISKFKSKPKSEQNKQSTSDHMSSLHDDRIPINMQYPGWREPRNPFAIGHDDLDPIGAYGGSGMLMDPRRFPNIGVRSPDSERFQRPLPGNMPRGAVPPGARFDPIGPFPLGGNRPDFSRSNPDHLPPPGYDDMFM